MKKKTAFVLVIAIVLGVFFSNQVLAGQVITVDDDGPADYSTIQDAIDAAVDGDIVIVADGIYTGEGNKNIDFGFGGKGIGIIDIGGKDIVAGDIVIVADGTYTDEGSSDIISGGGEPIKIISPIGGVGKSITVESENGPENCIVDCENNGMGFLFQSGEDANSVLDGFTIINASDIGGAIFCHGSTPTITHCIITNNSGSLGGGITCVYGASPNISYCTISDNNGNRAGGIYCKKSSPNITNCTISNNNGGVYAGGISCQDGNLNIADSNVSGNNGGLYGGGIYCQNGNPNITNCTISNNNGGQCGGGITCWNGNAIISNCTVTNNSSEHGGGIYCTGGNPTITDCIISNNVAEYAGGICAKGCPTIINCVITDNQSTSAEAGGIVCSSYDNRSPVISNCLIARNSAKYTAGVVLTGQSTPTMSNCTIVDNVSLIGGLGGGIWVHNNATATITNSIVWDNSHSQIHVTTGAGASTAYINYCDVQGGWPGEGNVNANPLFVSGPFGDYYLSQTDAGQGSDSPCVDTGSDQASVLGMSIHTTRTNEVFDSGIVDMGYHYMACLPAEIDIDQDTLNLSSNGKWISCRIWLPVDYDVADVNADSILLEGQIAAAQIWVNEEEQVVMTKFSRAEVQDILEAGEVELVVSGELVDGAKFEGTDTIRVIDKGSKKN